MRTGTELENEQLIKGTVTGVSQHELESKMLLVELLIATEKKIRLV